MADPFTGEIRMFAGDYAPVNWSLCAGTTLQILQNEALYSLFGTMYGGDGRSTFGLPDLRGRIPVGAQQSGNGPGLSPYRFGQKGGDEKIKLTTGQIPKHSHLFFVNENMASSSSPIGRVPAVAGYDTPMQYRSQDTATNESFASTAIAKAGGGEGHDNVMTFICINYIVCLFGLYPSRP